MDNQILTDQVSIAIINTNISHIKEDITTIKDAIKDLAGVYATNKDLQEVAMQTEKRLILLEKQSNFWKWMSPTLAAGATAITEYLFLFYVQHLGK